ncbi:MAG: hypothetical protein GX081_07990 [Firmicutes bacterium]|nr:hypothetical protein [Bacillota bacterium]
MIRVDTDVIEHELRQAKESEIFISQKDREYMIKTANGESSYFFTSNTGIAGRVFEGGKVGFSYRPGLEIKKIKEILMDARASLTYTHMKGAMVHGHTPSIDFQLKSSGKKINHNTVDKWFAFLTEKLTGTGVYLKKLYYLKDEGSYLLVNSNGVKGGGTHSFTALGLELGLKNGNGEISFLLNRLGPGDNITGGNWIKELQTLLQMNTVPFVKSTTLNCYLLLTPQAVAALIYIFLSCLTSEVIYHKRSFIRLNNEKAFFGKELTIIENAKDNQIYTGTVDGEGTKKEEKTIIDQGMLCNIISDFFYGSRLGIASTASCWRDTYRNYPVVKGNAVAVSRGEKTINELLNSVNPVLLINDLLGIASGFNPFTGDFQITSTGYLWQKGEFTGKARLYLEGNLCLFFNSVLAKSKEREYGVDGSVYVPAFLFDQRPVKVLQ